MAHHESARPEWAALEVVHDLAGAKVALVSPESDWNALAATRFLLRNIDVTLPALGVPAFGVNYGTDMQLERTLHGKKVSGCGTAGHLSILPPDADTRWVFDKPGDIVLVLLNRQLFDQAIEESTDRDSSTGALRPWSRTAAQVFKRARMDHRNVGLGIFVWLDCVLEQPLLPT